MFSKNSNYLTAIITLMLLLTSINSFADFEVCNKSQKYPVSVAIAFQTELLFGGGNYDVSGWNHIQPQKCAVLLKGDAVNGNYSGYKFWLHAVSNGVILVDNGSVGDIKDYSSQQFCVSSDKFTFEGRGDGVTQSCTKNSYLAPFPISVIPFNDDPLVNLFPDEVIKNNLNKKPTVNPSLPDLYGALAISSTGRYTSAYLKENVQQASSETMDFCKSNEPGATCEIIKTFRNQCMSVVKGKNKPAVILLGGPNSTKQDVRDGALQKCANQADSDCKERITVCSTYEEKSARQKEHKDKIAAEVMGATVEILKGIIPPSRPIATDPKVLVQHRVWRECDLVTDEKFNTLRKSNTRDISGEKYAFSEACKQNYNNMTEQPTPVEIDHKMECNFLHERQENFRNSLKDMISRTPIPVPENQKGIMKHYETRLKKVENSYAVVCEGAADDSLSQFEENKTKNSSEETINTPSTGTKDIEDTSPDGLPKANLTPQQQAAKRQCDAIGNSIAQAEERASGFRDWIAVKRMKSDYSKKCGIYANEN